MTTFDQKFVEDPRFLKWIFDNNPDIGKFWEQYILEHPEEKEQILELKSRLSELKFSNDKLLHSEKAELESRIRKELDLEMKRKSRRLILASFMKYAALIFVLSAISGLIIYLNKENKGPGYQQFVNQPVQIPRNAQGPLLITSNGENVNLRKSSSSVDYSRNGAIVVNNDSVIQATVDEPNVMNQMIIPYGNQSKVTLADNTVVWLNAGSRLVYPTRFDGKTREVMLFGEAFFEVSKNPKKPFIVKTSDLEIQVLGTQFNVSSYAEDQLIQTVLKEGSVSVKRNNATLFDKELILKPNQMASFNKNTRETQVSEVDANSFTLWTKGLLGFEEKDFGLIIRKLERYYNISIGFSDPKYSAIRISGKLDMKKNQDEVFEYLEKVSLTKIVTIGDNQYMVIK